MAFVLKQNDTAPAYVADLKDDFDDPSPTAIDLTNATSVTFKMRVVDAVASASPKVSRAMTVTDAATGRVTHTWLAADTDTAGDFNVEFEIAWNDGTVETIPNGADPDAQYLTVTVVDDLDADA